MIDATWLVFTIASLVFIATPGQDMILVMSRSVAQGAAAGVVTAAGVSVGLVGHTALATLGLGAILRTSEWLFVALKFVGAAYLIYLGIALLRTRQSTLPVGFFAGKLSAWLRSRPGVLTWAFRSSGAILVGLGVRLAFERR
jgi:threonine/homoserine/homoserine lactone efflux protein